VEYEKSTAGRTEHYPKRSERVPTPGNAPLKDIRIVMTKSKKCPQCGEQILAVAIKCKHCHAMMDQHGHVPTEQSSTSPIGVNMRNISSRINPSPQSVQLVAPQHRTSIIGYIIMMFIGLIIGYFIGISNPLSRFSLGQLMTSVPRFSSPTKDEWKANLEDKLKGYFIFPHTEIRAPLDIFYKAMGKPDHTEEDGIDGYWYYNCSDGVIKLKIYMPQVHQYHIINAAIT